MASNIEIIRKSAEALGMSYDKKRTVGYGTCEGFTMLIKPCPASISQTISLSFCAGMNGQPADRQIIESSGLISQGVKYSVIGFLHVFEVKVTFKLSTFIEKLAEIAGIAASALYTAGYANCSSNGSEGQTEIYQLKNDYIFLTQSEANEKESELNDSKREYDKTDENRPMGILGALAGSLAGVLVIVLIGRLGRVSILGGFLMGIVSVQGYKLLGHKLSTAGAVICTLIAVIMSYLSFRIDAAIDLVNIFKDTEVAADFTFPVCFAHAKTYYEFGGVLDTYYTNMALILISGTGGAAGAIWSDRADTKKGFVLAKIGE